MRHRLSVLLSLLSLVVGGCSLVQETLELAVVGLPECVRTIDVKLVQKQDNSNSEQTHYGVQSVKGRAETAIWTGGVLGLDLEHPVQISLRVLDIEDACPLRSGEWLSWEARLQRSKDGKQIEVQTPPVLPVNNTR